MRISYVLRLSVLLYYTAYQIRKKKYSPKFPTSRVEGSIPGLKFSMQDLLECSCHVVCVLDVGSSAFVHCGQKTIIAMTRVSTKSSILVILQSLEREGIHSR